MKLVGPQIILLLGCAYFGLAQNLQNDYLPPNPDGSGNNFHVFSPTPPPTTRRTPPPRTTPPRVTPPRVTPPRVTPPRVTPPRVTPPRVTPPRVTPPRVTPPRVTPPRPTPPRPTPPRPTPEPHHHHHDDHHHHSSDPLQWLRDAVPGEPGDDYPIYWQIPETQFSCDGRGIGIYADVETRCQVFHMCSQGAGGALDYISMLCPNGTIFNQEHFTCEWWQSVNCQSTEQFYVLNEKIGVVPEGAPSGNINHRVRPDPSPRQPAPAPVPRPRQPAPAPVPRPRQPAPAPRPRQPAPAPVPRPRQPAPAPIQPRPRQPAPAPRPRQPSPPRPRQPSPSRPRQPAPAPRPRQPFPSRPRQPAPRQPISNTIDDGYDYGSPSGVYNTPTHGEYGRRL